MIILIFAMSLFAKEEYPVISYVKGGVEYKKSAGAIEKAVSKTILHEKAYFKTAANGIIRIDLDPNSYAIITENSELEFPVIEWGSGNVQDLILKSGKIFYSCIKTCERNIRTALSYERYGPGQYFLEINPQVPFVKGSVLHGQMLFRGLEVEESKLLSAGEQARFLGKIEGGEIQYDVLLKGRKIARGKLEMLPPMTQSEIATYEKAFDFKGVEIKKKKQIQAARTKDQICDKPFGRLNECVWQLEKASCIRKRCFADGVWKDRFDYKGQGPCLQIPKVQKCDY